MDPKKTSFPLLLITSELDPVTPKSGCVFWALCLRSRPWSLTVILVLTACPRSFPDRSF